MTRYHFEANWAGESLHENDCMVPWSGGGWVRYNDAEASYAALKKAARQVIKASPKRVGKEMLLALAELDTALAELQKRPTPPGGWTAARERIERFCNAPDEDEPQEEKEEPK